MAMSAATLSSELDAQVDNINSEPTAIVAWTTAWENYWSNATAGAVPVSPAGLSLGNAAMATALVGMSAPNAGAAVIQNAITAWWAAIVLGFAAAFPGSIAVTAAPGLAGIAAALTPVFAANTAGSLTKTNALNAIALVLHPLNLGGTATFPPAVVQNIL